MPTHAVFAQTGQAGTWTTTQDTEFGSFEIRILLEQDANGLWSGSSSRIPENGDVLTLPLENITIVGNVVLFEIKIQGMTIKFNGRYSPEEDTVTGHFSAPQQTQIPEDVVYTRMSAESAADTDTVAEAVPTRVRHPQSLAAAVRLQMLAPLHIVKINVMNINDVMEAGFGADAGIRWYPLDGWAIEARYFRGGLDVNWSRALVSEQDLFVEELGVNIVRNADDVVTSYDPSYLALDGWTLATKFYVGPALFPDSRYNPYLTFAGGQTTWELTRSGRGSAILAIMEEPLTATDYHVGWGLGTEWELNAHMSLDLEWFWNYHMTSDETIWEDTDRLWTNQHVWNLSLGFIYGF